VSNVDSALDDGLVLAFEDVTRRRTNIHEMRYTASATLLAALRARRRGEESWQGGDLGEDGGGDDDDDDDEAQDENRAEDDEERVDSSPEWPLAGVSFSLAAGEAIGVIGDADAVTAVSRLLTRMSTPSSGRILHRGRIGISAELAKLAARRETGTKQALHALATVAAVPRRERKEWMRAVLETATGGSRTGDLPELTAVRGPLRIASTIDPTSNVLVLDQLPRRSDAAYHQRCIDRVRKRLVAGAGAVVTSPDLVSIIELCHRTILLEHGRVVAEGPSSQIVEQFGRARAVDREALPLHPFNDQAAIVSAELAASPPSELRVVVRLETAQPDLGVVWRFRVDDALEARHVSEKGPTTVRQPGSYRITLTAPAAALRPGDLTVAVEAHIVASDRRALLRRPVTGDLRVRAAGTEPSPKSVAVQSEWQRDGPSPPR
jgi:ABC-type polysaccharide/polyol phosphate transport system ATPase subunit